MSEKIGEIIKEDDKVYVVRGGRKIPVDELIDACKNLEEEEEINKCIESLIKESEE